MFWLFAQMFVLCGFAFLAGAVLTWLPMRATIRGLRAELTRPTTPPRPALPAGTLVIPAQPKPAPEAVEGPQDTDEPEGTDEPEDPDRPEDTDRPGPAHEPEADRQADREAELAADPAPDLDADPAAPASAFGPAGAPAPEFGAAATQSAVVEVKGSSKSMIFHTPDSPYFKRMKGDVTFRSIAEAEQAGYTQWRPKSTAAQAR